jgi:ABC-2 type transport system ATP-binding protein
MQVPSGSIYGFLGPNGAGKTTTLRLVLGLLKKQQGHIKLFGNELEANRIEILKRLGSLIEQPSLYQHLTAKENLKIYKGVYNVGTRRIEAVLELVDLHKTGSKKVKQFSLGMKQRLSIALALLHQPELLILDEPTNGLDPNGIIEVRELLKKLKQEQDTTILVSSHLLAEVEKMATYVGIIHEGKLLFQGTVSALQQLKKKQSVLEIATAQPEVAYGILKNNYEVELSKDLLLMPYTDNETSAIINKLLVLKGVDVFALHHRQNDLEQLFIDITSNSK